MLVDTLKLPTCRKWLNEMKNEIKIECIKSLKMLNSEKRTAFIEGNFYILKERTERSISLINEQGYIHTIDGECLEYFKIPTDEK